MAEDPGAILDTIRTARADYEAHLMDLLRELAAEAAAKFPGEIGTVSLYDGEVLIGSKPGTDDGVHWDRLLPTALKVEDAGMRYRSATGGGFVSGLLLRASTTPDTVADASLSAA